MPAANTSWTQEQTSGPAGPRRNQPLRYARATCPEYPLERAAGLAGSFLGGAAPQPAERIQNAPAVFYVPAR